MNRPDLMDLVGQRVTVTHPNSHTTSTGKLVALADHPTLILDLDDGHRMVYRQDRCKVTPADDTPAPIPPWEQEILDRQAATIGLENTLLAHLGRMLANLQQHIDQRAAELAQPLIDEACEAAAVEVSGARGMQQRAEDLVVEMRRQLAALERNYERYRQRAEAAEDAIVKTHDHLGRNLTGLIGKSGYEVGYRSCADEVTHILNGTNGQAEGTPA